MAQSIIRKMLNKNLDKLAHPEFYMFHRSWYAFQVCGYTGLVVSILLEMTLIDLVGLSPWVMIGVIGNAVLTFLGLAMTTKIITGEEQLIYYHHQIAILIITAIFLKVINRPILPYLDLTILGIGAFLVCGRVGCLMVGCCHGRPHKCGICYRKEHVDAGFKHYYQGVRLFPIQAVESVWVLFIVITGVELILTRQSPGQALAWYVVAYDIGRFIFEFARGDPERHYYGGFSEGQWISVILMCAVVGGEVVGVLPFHLWHSIATAGIVLTMIALALIRRGQGTGTHQLLNPRHVREIAEAIDEISSRVSEGTVVKGAHPLPEVIPMNPTSLGIQLSGGKIKSADTSIAHFAFSSQNGTMSKETARSVADLIIQVKHLSGAIRLISGGNGVFHLLIQPLNAGDPRWANTL